MNTAGSSSDAKAAGGYGNVEFNGLPATSNGYILDGFDSNDPWLGLNIGLATNLVIGLDAVQEATVNTKSFSVDQGRYAVAQVSFITSQERMDFTGTCPKSITALALTRRITLSTRTIPKKWSKSRVML